MVLHLIFQNPSHKFLYKIVQILNEIYKVFLHYGIMNIFLRLIYYS